MEIGLFVVRTILEGPSVTNEKTTKCHIVIYKKDKHKKRDGLTIPFTLVREIYVVATATLLLEKSGAAKKGLTVKT